MEQIDDKQGVCSASFVEHPEQDFHCEFRAECMVKSPKKCPHLDAKKILDN